MGSFGASPAVGAGCLVTPTASATAGKTTVGWRAPASSSGPLDLLRYHGDEPPLYLAVTDGEGMLFFGLRS